jgi:filamentous hemagglutinin
LRVDPAKDRCVHAGDAGLRATGNLNIAALRVLNADNIKVGGTVTGVPVQQGVTGALTTETKNNAAADAVKDATLAGPSERPSVIIVEVLGYGGDGGEDIQRRQDEERERRSDSQHQDPSSRYHVVGVGVVTEEEARQLADKKRKLIGR